MGYGLQRFICAKISEAAEALLHALWEEAKALLLQLKAKKIHYTKTERMIVNCSSYIFLLFTSNSFSCEVSLFFFLLVSFSVFFMLLAVMYCKKDIVLIASRWMRQNQQEIGMSMRGWRPSCDKSWQRRFLTNPVYNSTRRSFRLGQRALKMFIWCAPRRLGYIILIYTKLIIKIHWPKNMDNGHCIK